VGDFPDPDRQAASRDLVERLLAGLRPADRLLMQLIHLEGRSIEEVKKITGWNNSLIKVRAFRARRKLKKQFGKLVQEKVV